jgi:hypothetical protein
VKFEFLKTGNEDRNYFGLKVLVSGRNGLWEGGGCQMGLGNRVLGSKIQILRTVKNC